MLIGYLDILFCEMPVQLFLNLFLLFIYLFLILAVPGLLLSAGFSLVETSEAYSLGRQVHCSASLVSEHML